MITIDMRNLPPLSCDLWDVLFQRIKKAVAEELACHQCEVFVNSLATTKSSGDLLGICPCIVDVFYWRKSRQRSEMARERLAKALSDQIYPLLRGFPKPRIICRIDDAAHLYYGKR